jgi:endonuclease/exonuclease/phosphatase family metal-dependent hydrolase
VALAEVTAQHQAAIDELLPATTYPWRALEPDQAPSKGFAILSRVPLAKVERWWSQGHPQLDVIVSPPGAEELRLLVIHTWGPDGARKIALWRAQFEEVADRARGSAGTRPTVLIGDYNATIQHRSFQRLVKAGWRDAGTRSLAGWKPTWPDNWWWLPALFRLDHILVGPGISVRWRQTGRSLGSDHRPVSAILVLPASVG